MNSDRDRSVVVVVRVIVQAIVRVRLRLVRLLEVRAQARRAESRRASEISSDMRIWTSRNASRSGYFAAMSCAR